MEEKNLTEIENETKNEIETLPEVENFNLATEIDTLEMFQDNPFTFIEEAWGLTAQPPHPEYRDYLLKLYTIPYHEWSDYVSTITVKMFQPFENGKHITWQQSLLLIAVQRAITEPDFPKLIAVKAGRGIGKSNVLSMLILWYLFSFPLSKIPCTAPTADQLFAVLWSEANLMLSKMKPEFAKQYEWTSSFIKMKAHPVVWYARAKTSAKGQTGSLSGLHCFEEGTVEVMTKTGFKSFEDITFNDFVMTRDGWRKPTDIIRKQYRGKMIYQDGLLFSYSVTPEHKFPVQLYNSHYIDNKRPKWGEERLIAVKDWGKRTVKIPRYITTDYGKEKTTYTIPRYKNRYKSQPPREVFDVAMDDWLAFLGWYLSEGNISNSAIHIAQSKVNQPKRDEIAEVVKRLGFRPAICKGRISLCNAQVASHIKKLCPGKEPQKRVPKFIFGLSKRQIDIFLDAYRKGDGFIETETKRLGYVTSSQGMVNDLQRLTLLAGRYATFRVCAKKGSLMNVGEKYGRRNQDVYTLREWNDNSNLHAISKGMQRKEKDYDGIVECLTVPSGMFYVRDKKTTQGFWTGNSSTMMAVADEAYDIEDEVFQVADATQTGDKSLMIIVGNAVRDTGYFYDAFNNHKDSWIRITMNAEESPVVNRKKIEAQERMYGRLSNHYRQSVLGEFPIATAVDIDGWRRLFNDDWIENVFTYSTKDADDTQNETAMNELFSLKNWQTGRVFLGIDPAGEGDDEAVGYIHNGQLAMKVFNRQVVDDITLANFIIDTVNTYHIESMDITVDNFGVGAEVSKNVLLASDGRISPEGKNVGDKCEELLDQQVYSNEKARLYDMLYWWGRRGGKIFYDHGLKEELKTIFARRTDTGKLQIMGKREMRKREYKSPNRTEALILSFFNDRMMSNYIPRGDYRGVTAFPKPRQNWFHEKSQKKINEGYDPYASIPFM